jgi:hypothetical protein
MMHHPKSSFSLLGLVGLLLLAAPRPAMTSTHFLVVEGLGGRLDYAERFRKQVEEMLPALRRTAGDDSLVHVLAGNEATAERVRAVLEDLGRAVAPGDAVAVFLIGHGSHDGRHYKFNIPGPDFTDEQLKSWLDGVPAARQLVVSTTSSSGGALETLKSSRRIVVTATRNGRERNATVFGQYWVEAFSAPSADTDKNESISALEAFRYAESKVKAHYADNKRLATEHPQIQGDRAGGFVLARLGTMAELARDPEKRALLDRREELERRIADLTLRKDDLPQDEYLDSLQALLLQLAELQEQIDADAGASGEEVP